MEKGKVGLLVLGIDPGTRLIGFGLICVDRGCFRAVDYGYYRINHKLPFPQRLKQIYQTVSDLIDKSNSEAIAVEEIYVSQNAKATLRLGHARGVILLAAVMRDIPVIEYAPREIKKAIVGQGGASKDQVKWMTAQILNLQVDELQNDAADGLAVALCHGLRYSKIRKSILKIEK
jgi:crossover junction endodeoxyribonuclease RuvC